MSLTSLHRTVHRIGNVENWLRRTELKDRRIRMIDVKDQVRKPCYDSAPFRLLRC